MTIRKFEDLDVLKNTGELRRKVRDSGIEEKKPDKRNIQTNVVWFNQKQVTNSSEHKT